MNFLLLRTMLYLPKENCMIRNRIRTLMCETDRLAELMDVPMADVLGFADRADELDPRHALLILAQLYVENCGVSAGVRSVIYYAADYWMEKLNIRDTFNLLMPELSGEYKEYQEEYDRYDTIVLTCKKTRDIACKLLRDLDGDDAKIALCAGVMHDLQNNSWPSVAAIESRDLEDIESNIILLEDEELMKIRKKELWYKHSSNGGFTQEEVSHLVSLNCKLIELQHKVFNQVCRITIQLQKELAAGNNDYEDFNVEGWIYIEYSDDTAYDELLNVLIDAVPQYQAILTGSHTSQKDIDEKTCSHIHWWSNWDGRFKELVCKHNIPVCRAFKHLFDMDSPLTMEDIMKIRPEQLLTKVTVHI